MWPPLTWHSKVADAQRMFCRCSESHLEARAPGSLELSEAGADGGEGHHGLASRDVEGPELLVGREEDARHVDAAAGVEGLEALSGRHDSFDPW